MEYTVADYSRPMTPSSFPISIFINLYESMVAKYGTRGSVAAQK